MAEFVPFAAWMRERERANGPAVATSAQTLAVASAIVVEPPHAAMLGELAMLRLAAIEAFDRATGRMLAALAADVLGRELALAPVDLDALVATALAHFAACEPIALALCAQDARRVRSPLPIRVDPSLVPGDLVVDVRDGTLEATFAFRVRDAVARASGGPS